jgi:FkbM family methyltransferase
MADTTGLDPRAATDRLPLRARLGGSIMRILTGRLRGSRLVVSAGDNSWLGVVDIDKQKHFADHIKPGHTVYDIGADIGFDALLAARLVGPAGKVYAFEPSPRNLPKLQRHVDMNRAANIKVVGCAIADEPGEMSFEIPNFVFNDDGYMGRLASGGSVTVAIETIDGLLAAGEIQPAHVVKLGAKGAQHATLVGGANFFRAHKPVIFLAAHDRAIHAECCALLRSWGYELAPLDPAADVHAAGELIALCPQH